MANTPAKLSHNPLEAFKRLPAPVDSAEAAEALDEEVADAEPRTLSTAAAMAVSEGRLESVPYEEDNEARRDR